MSKLQVIGSPTEFDTEKQKRSLMEYFSVVKGLDPTIRNETAELLHKLCRKKRLSEETEEEIFQIADVICYETFCDTVDLPFIKLVFDK